MPGDEKIIPNYVAIAVEKPRREHQLVGHGRLRPDRLCGSLRLEIELLGPVFVGSGTYSLYEGQPIKIPVLSGGVPVVPGSSIKGACRQTFEILVEGDGPFDPRERGQRPPKDPPWSWDRALFGKLGYQGRISFDDAKPKSALEQLELVRIKVPYKPGKDLGRRFYGRLKERRVDREKVPIAALPTGTWLTSTLHFENVTQEELGLVLLGLGVGGRFTPRLGGGKYDRCGWVRIEPVALELRKSAASGGTESLETVLGWVQDAERKLASPGRKALGILQTTLQSETPRPAEMIRLEFLASGALEKALPLERKVDLLAKVGPLLNEIARARVPRSGGGSDSNISVSAFGRLVAFHREHRSLDLLRKFLAKLEILDLYEQPNHEKPLATFWVLKDILQKWLEREAALDAAEVLYVWSWVQRQLSGASRTPGAAVRNGPPARIPPPPPGPRRGAPEPPPRRVEEPFRGGSLAEQFRKKGLAPDQNPDSHKKK